MPQPKLFRPAEALVFRSLPEQFIVIHKMRELYQDFVHKGYASCSAFYYAFVLTHVNGHGIATDLGVNEFYKQMTSLLGVALEFVEYTTERRFSPFHDNLAFHETVANELDPIVMLKLATEDPGAHASRLNRRLHFEAGRQLGIALQLFAIEGVDPDAWVSEDLGKIEHLSWERLFVPDASEDIWVVAELWPPNENGGRVKSINLAQSAEEKNRLVRSPGSQARVHATKLPCRVVQHDKGRVYVFVSRRRKRLLSTLMKLERGRPHTDRRGLKYVVVGLENEHSLRTADPGDAVRFSKLTQHRLWQPPLVQEIDLSPPNPDSDERYCDIKTVGRFERYDNGRIVAGPVEQLVTSIGPYIDTLVATNGRLSHVLYTNHKALKFIAPLWFPHRRGTYDATPQFRLPGYDIDWEQESIVHQLESWWRSQL